MANLQPHQQQMLDTATKTGYGLWSGVECVEISEGIGRVTFKPRAEMLTPWGTLNGGVVTSLVEIPSFVSLLTTIGENDLPVTNDIFLQHMRPLPSDCVYEMVGTLIRRGKTMAWTEVAVNANGATVSIARITKTIAKKG
jgi:uncharacterized protein (TIGR00369 family)